jgi:hypothetical protein
MSDWPRLRIRTLTDRFVSDIKIKIVDPSFRWAASLDVLVGRYRGGNDKLGFIVSGIPHFGVACTIVDNYDWIGVAHYRWLYTFG